MLLCYHNIPPRKFINIKYGRIKVVPIEGSFVTKVLTSVNSPIQRKGKGARRFPTGRSFTALVPKIEIL